jgi:hypothetical protein
MQWKLGEVTGNEEMKIITTTIIIIIIIIIIAAADKRLEFSITRVMMKGMNLGQRFLTL